MTSLVETLLMTLLLISLVRGSFQQWNGHIHADQQIETGKDKLNKALAALYSQTPENQLRFDFQFAVVSTPADDTEMASNPGRERGLQQAVKEVAFVLRSLKFSLKDPRFVSSSMQTLLYEEFPSPPIILDHQVKRHCSRSFVKCIFFLQVLAEQWNAFFQGDTKKCRECTQKKNQLQSSFAFYRLVVTSLYFLCWYTMQGVHHLAYIGRCNEPRFSSLSASDTGGDVRANQGAEFQCSRHSFCPELCCPHSIVRTKSECLDSMLNPCYAHNPSGKRDCKLEHHKNLNFNSIRQGRLNITCHCNNRKGEEFDSSLNMCVDIDECRTRRHDCDRTTQDCVNSRGSYFCICKQGYFWNTMSGKCHISEVMKEEYVLKLHNQHHKLENKLSTTVTGFINPLNIRYHQNDFINFGYTAMLFFKKVLVKVDLALTEAGLFIQRVAEALGIGLEPHWGPTHHRYPTDEDIIIRLDEEAMAGLHEQGADLEVDEMPV